MSGEVFVGYADYGQWVPEFGESLADFYIHDALGPRHLGGRCRARGPYIPENRTRIGQEFLATDCAWLWMVDIDVKFPPGILDGLLSVADPTDKPIVAALYFSSYDSTPAGSWWPMWMEDDGHGGSKIVDAVKLGELRPLTMAGTGCMLIHRSVLERLAGIHADDPWPWFGHDISADGKQRCGEDVTFCARARAAGFSIWGLAVPLVHKKTIDVGWDAWVAQSQKEVVADAPVREGLLSQPGGTLQVPQFRNREERRRQPKGLRAGR